MKSRSIMSVKAVLVASLFVVCTLVDVVRAQESTGPSETTDGPVETLKPEQIEYFETKVRPLLVEHCYECHSAEADFAEASLLLDSKAGWQHGGDSGPAIKPGDVESSLLIEAVRYKEERVSGMPPRSKLPQEQIEVLERWVAMGAPDPRQGDTLASASNVDDFRLQQRVEQHWSWRPVQSPAVPEVSEASWPVNEIDHFILAKLEQAGLAPASEASKEVWLRRVYFDLIGLPPSVEQIDAFLADQSPDAHAKVVDQLLRSSHFGEKWARHWMDLVRYADTYGHEFDYPIPHAHEYRDYVIRALNADVPYDQFVTEHIAGDLLPEPRRHPQQGYNESVLATAFWYLHEATHAPTDVLGNEADIADNQIDVFGKAFLGLTVACARCHDHKFDAISTADYYALSAYLHSSCRQRVRIDEDRRAAIADATIERLRAEAEQDLRQIDWRAATRTRPGAYYQAAVQLRKAVADGRPWEEVDAELVTSDAIGQVSQQRGLDVDRLRRWVSAAPAVGRALHTTEGASAPDRSSSALKDKDAVVFATFDKDELPQGWSTTGNAFRAVGSSPRLGVDGKLARQGTVTSHLGGARQVGILRSPTFEITSRQIHVRLKATSDAVVRLVIDNYAMADFSALLFNGTFLRNEAIDTDGKWAWKSLNNDLRKYLGHRAYLEIVDEPNGSIQIDSILFSDHGPPASEMRVAESTHAAFVNAKWREAIEQLRRGQSHALVRAALEHELVTLDELSASAADRLAKAAEVAAQIPPPRYALAMAQGTRENAHVYIRGSHVNLGEEVPPRFLEALGGTEGDRLTLAREVASEDNPLTARVMVNRLWHHLFGRGIVPTVDDFGPQGQPPSHPDLLDWMAADFVNGHWSIKRMIRAIVLSKTYRQASVPHPSLSDQQIAQRDPSNEWLHCMPVRRLPAEAIRDAILAISGRLDAKPFGPGVPTHRTEFMTGRGAKASGPLDGGGRRSVYLSVYRNFMNPFLLAFDTPSPFGPQGRRSRSNVPAQSLTLMNDPFVVQQAGRWADRMLEESQLSDAERVNKMVRQAHGIRPSEDQLDRLQDFLHAQTQLYGQSPESDKPDRRAWADLAHALFNMKSFYFVR